MNDGLVFGFRNIPIVWDLLFPQVILEYVILDYDAKMLDMGRMMITPL